MVFGVVGVPPTCLALGTVDTDKVYDPQVRMTTSLPDDCDTKEAGRALCFGIGGRQGGCGSAVRRDCAGRRREAKKNRMSCCFREDRVSRPRELDVVLGLGLRERRVGFYGPRLA
jgi:hypothetical protein